MEIKINKQSEVSVRDQLCAQLIFLIATGELKAGEQLPSVRALARKLKIHHNTVSGAYQDLAGKDLLTSRHGSRMVVQSTHLPSGEGTVKDLDDLINDTLHLARRHGFTLRQLKERVQERMLEEPPDHILALSIDSGMRKLFELELGENFTCPVESCSPAELVANPATAIGAVVITPPGALPTIRRVLPKSRPAIPIIYSDAREQLAMVRQLREPSLVAVASVSEGFLEIARGLLSPVLGPRHSLVEYLLSGETRGFPPSADILFCDSAAYGLLRRRTKWKRIIPYRLISKNCVDEILCTLKSTDSHRVCQLKRRVF